MTPEEPVDDVADLLAREMYYVLLGAADGWAKLNITMPQLKVLMLLGRYGSAAVSWLAARMAVSPPNVTGILDRIEHQGWVRRTGDAHDRRVVRVVLTPSGEQLLQELHVAGREEVRGILSRMDPTDREALRRGLAAFLRAAGSAPVPAGDS